ncbi:MAG: hypothetical protein ACXWTP_07750 [Methylosarcina sp.]
MAKNLLEQFLSFASSKLAGPIAHENIYREEESTELSSVAKYLAKQEAAEKAKEAASVPPTATGVEKYLARQALLSAGEASVAEAPEAAQQEPLTGVAKYLAGQGRAAKPAVKEEPAPAPEPVTGVGRYLAGQSRAGTHGSEVAKVTASEPQKATQPATKTAAAQPEKVRVSQQKTAEPEIAAPASAPVSEPPAAAASKPASAVIHLDDGKQCQASTVKGTQCKHTTHLGHIQRTINKQKYQFTVCNQHHNETFKPFAPLLSAKDQ